MHYSSSFFMKQNVICRSKKKRKKFKKKSEKQAESISTLCDTMRKQIINRFENVFTSSRIIYTIYTALHAINIDSNVVTYFNEGHSTDG